MGACSIEMIVKGDKTKEEVVKAFRERQDEDRANNGHNDGYSGDFQTVHNVRFSGKEFENENDALDYCFANAEKWVDVVAVKIVNESRNEWLIAGWGAE